MFKRLHMASLVEFTMFTKLWSKVVGAELLEMGEARHSVGTLLALRYHCHALSSVVVFSHFRLHFLKGL